MCRFGMYRNKNRFIFFDDDDGDTEQRKINSQQSNVAKATKKQDV